MADNPQVKGGVIPYLTVDGAAKAAVVAVTRTLALELALDNIRVNAIAPGTTVTPGAGAYIDEDPERDRRAIAIEHNR